MAVLPVQISENGRQRLCTVLWIVHWACAVCGLSVICIGVYIKMRIQDKVNLVEGYDGNTLPLVLICIGAVTLVIDLAGGQLCHKVADISRREKLKSLLLPYLALFLVLNVCIFIAGCMCFAHRLHLQHSFHRGLTNAMKSYKDKEAVKFEINQLQVDFECCGNEGYDDRFAVQWVGADYLDTGNKIIQSKVKEGQYLTDDVPYSCCKQDQLRPCIHHHVHDNDRHVNYDYRETLTLNSRGCKHALMDYFTARLNWIGGITLLIFILQSVIFLMLRYLETSIGNAYEAEDPEATAHGWLLAKIPFKFAEWSDLKEAQEDISVASDDSFSIVSQRDSSDEGFERAAGSQRAQSKKKTPQNKSQRARPGAREPIYENWPPDDDDDDFGFDFPDAEGLKRDKPKDGKSQQKSKSDKKSKSQKKSTSEEKSKSQKKAGSKDKKSTDFTKKSPGSTKKSQASRKKASESTKKSPASTKKSPGSAKKSTGSTKKSPRSSKKSTGSTKKSPGSAKKSPGSTKKAAGSTKKSPGSTKKSSGTTKKSPGSTKKSPGSTKKSPGSTKKSPGSTKKSGSAKRSAGSTKKTAGSTRKSPGSSKKARGSTNPGPASGPRALVESNFSKADMSMSITSAVICK